jgi:alpha-2-macroglobulin
MILKALFANVSFDLPFAWALHYLVRSVTPGTFGWPGATAQLQYASEEFGRSAAATLAVSANPE